MSSATQKHPFPIIPHKAWWFSLSTLIVVAGFVGMFVNQQKTGHALNYGVDFTGGAVYTYKFGKLPGAAPAETIRQIREVIDPLKTKSDIRQAKIQVFADGGVQIRTATGADPGAKVQTAMADAKSEAETLLAALRGKFTNVELVGSDLVGPVIGQQLRMMAIMAVFWGCLAITIYIAFRYNIKGVGGGWLFGVCAVIALIHDVLVMISVYAWTHTEVNTNFVAAVLTVVGYSVNDTVIIFDRIRENMGKLDTAQRRSHALVEDVMEQSLWQVMTRSLVTVFATLLPLIMLFLFGGVTIRDFAFALLVGIISGCYSSIFNAPPLFSVFYRMRLKKAEASGQFAAPQQRTRPTARPRPTETALAERPAATAPRPQRERPRPETPTTPTTDRTAEPTAPAAGGEDTGGAARKKPTSGGSASAGGKRKRRH